MLASYKTNQIAALWNCTALQTYSHLLKWPCANLVVLYKKFRPLKALGDLYTLAMSQVSYTERTITTMVTKDWSTKIGLSRFPNNAHEHLRFIKGDISQDKTMTIMKNYLHVAIISIFD